MVNKLAKMVGCIMGFGWPEFVYIDSCMILLLCMSRIVIEFVCHVHSHRACQLMTLEFVCHVHSHRACQLMTLEFVCHVYSHRACQLMAL